MVVVDALGKLVDGDDELIVTRVPFLETVLGVCENLVHVEVCKNVAEDIYVYI